MVEDVNQKKQKFLKENRTKKGDLLEGRNNYFNLSQDLNRRHQNKSEKSAQILIIFYIQN